ERTVPIRHRCAKVCHRVRVRPVLASLQGSVRAAGMTNTVLEAELYESDAAFSVAGLFREHHRTLVAFLRARLRDRQEAEEVAQEAYVKLLQLGAGKDIRFLRSYLFR